MSVLVICDQCGGHPARRYYLSIAIGDGKGTKIVRRGDLCDSCADAIPLNDQSVRKKAKGPERRGAP